MATEYNSALYRDFPSTSKLTREDLEELLGSSRQAGRTPSGGEDTATAEQEAYFEAFVDSLPEVRQLFDEHARLLKENEEKATRNLSLQAQLEGLRTGTQQFYDRAIAAEKEWPAVERQMLDSYRRFTPGSLHAQLIQDANRLHEESEALAAAFVDGLPLPPSTGDGTDVAAAASSSTSTEGEKDTVFVKRYKELRTKYHRLNLVAERWSQGTVQWE